MRSEMRNLLVEHVPSSEDLASRQAYPLPLGKEYLP